MAELLTTAGTVLLWIVLGLAGWILLVQPILWAFVFNLHYKPQLARFSEDIPMMTAASYEPDPTAAPFEVTTEDGLTIRGSWLPAQTETPLGVILFCHELNGDRWNALPFAQCLRVAGFDVVTFDFRNQGQSDRKTGYNPLPWVSRFECQDVEAVLAAIEARAPKLPLGVLGVSRGANVAVWLASQSARVAALVTDGAYPLLGTLTYSMRRWMRIYTGYSFFFQVFPNWVIDWHLARVAHYVERQRGVSYIFPERAARRTQQPVLMIHGQRDAFIPAEVAQAMSRRFARLDRLWLVPGAKHNQSILTVKESYEQTLVAFFQKHVGSSPAITSPSRVTATAD